MLNTYVKEMDYTLPTEQQEIFFEIKLERAKSVWDFQLGLEYLESRASEEDFYVCWVTGSEVSDCTVKLFQICKEYFNKLKQEEKDELLRSFCFDDEHDYVDWYDAVYGLNL